MWNEMQKSSNIDLVFVLGNIRGNIGYRDIRGSGNEKFHFVD